MKTLYDSLGKRITLGKQIATGGEGTIYEVHGQPDIVAKLYHEEVLRTRGVTLSAKLSALCSICNESLERVAAWPRSLLYNQSQQVAGFIMRRIAGYKDIHLLYGNKSRKVEFPGTGWEFLVRTATNLARAFEVIHRHGLVIGDVNHGSVLVSREALVVLVDIDSIQIAQGATVYTCDVGVPTHTPPELQGLPLRGQRRSTNHDNFGLAVIIFQLLFLGRHPFAGTYLGTGDKSLEEAIKERRFAYGSNALSRLIKQPPYTLSLASVTATLATVFEKAFTSTAGRPTPSDWVSGLLALERNLRKCSVNTGHAFFTGLPQCPWCEIEISAAVRIFDGILTAAVGVIGFDLKSAWAAIEQVTLQPPDYSLTKGHQGLLSSLNPQSLTTPRVQSFVKMTFLFVGLTLSIFIASFSGPLNYASTGYLSLILGSIFLIFLINAFRKTFTAIRTEKRKNEDEIKGLFEKARIGNGNRLFDEKKIGFAKLRQEYEELPRTRLERLHRLEKEVRERQLYRYLDNFRITSFSIPSIGPARTAILRSYGIETAADINNTKIISIPGFGPTYANKLQSWRQSVERNFVFDSSRGVDPKDREEVERDIEMRSRQIQSELLYAPTDLRNYAAHIEANRKAFNAKTSQFTADYMSARGEEIALTRRAVLLLAPILLFNGLTTFTILSGLTNNKAQLQPQAQSQTPIPLVSPRTAPTNQVSLARPSTSTFPSKENLEFGKPTTTPSALPSVSAESMARITTPMQKPTPLLPTSNTGEPTASPGSSYDTSARSVPTRPASPAPTRDFDVQSRMNVASRLERLGVSVDWRNHSFSEMYDWEMRINIANRLHRIGLGVDWHKYSFSQMYDWEMRINIAQRLARKGLDVDWQKQSFSQMYDWEMRIDIAERLKRNGINVNWKDYSFTQLYEMERRIK